MTAPRTALFQRPSAEGSIPPEIMAALGGAGGPPPDGGEAPEPATCPACGAVFDPASGEIMQPPGDGGGPPPPDAGPPPMGA